MLKSCASVPIAVKKALETDKNYHTLLDELKIIDILCKMPIIMSKPVKNALCNIPAT
jgi:hypothetical protein